MFFKKPFHCIIVMILWGFFITAQATPEVLSLDEAIALALHTHPTLTLQKEKTYELRFKVEESWVDFFPQLALEGGSSHFENRDLRNVGIRLRYPLFEGGRVVYEYRKNEAQEKAGQARVQITEQKLILNVKRAYVNLLLEEELLKASQTEKDNLAKLFSIAEVLFSTGQVPQSDLIRIKTQLLESENRMIQEEKNRDVAHSVLLQLLSLDQTSDIKVSSDLSHVISERLSLEEALETAHIRRPEFKDFYYREKGIKSELNVEKSDYWPRIYLDGQYGGSNNPMGMRRDIGSFEEYWSIGINIEVNFWNWGKARTRARQTESRARQLRHEKNGFSNTLSFEVKEAYLLWKTAQKSLINAQELLSSSTQAYEILLEDYQTGKASNEVILESQNQLHQSQKNYENSFFEVFNTEFNLEQMLGLLGEVSGR
ncbi:MAG: TolC family protein [Deltaproteobacteria bacterium]|nr:TolC family protein [Deltaproteobacteria bacterium]